MANHRAWAPILAMIAWVGCDGGSGHLALDPASASAVAGTTTAVTATLTGFSGVVAVELVAPPAGISAPPLVLSSGTHEGVLTLAVDVDTAPGSYALELQAVGSEGTAVATFALEVTAGTGFGDLLVNVIADPAITGDVTITGPSGFVAHVTGTQSFPHVPAGAYQVVASPVVETGTALDTTWQPSVSAPTVNVTNGQLGAVTVTYAVPRFSRMLWFGVPSNNTLYGATDADLASTPVALSEQVAIDNNTAWHVWSLAFDAAGNLWTSYDFATSVIGFARDSLLVPGSPAPAVTLQLTSHVRSLHFDPDGNLWAWQNNGNGNDEVVMYSKAQLASSASVTPARVLHHGSPWSGIAFDRHGNLYVTYQSTGKVMMWTPAQLAMLGSTPTDIAPNVELTGVPHANSVAVDAAGNVWVGTDATGYGQVYLLTASQFATPGVRAAQLLTYLVRFGAGSADSIDDIVVDDHDDVWLAYNASSGFVLYMASPTDRATKPYFTPKFWGSSYSLGLALSPP